MLITCLKFICSIEIVSLQLGENKKNGIKVYVNARGKNQLGALVLNDEIYVLQNKSEAPRNIRKPWYSYHDNYVVIEQIE